MQSLCKIWTVRLMHLKFVVKVWLFSVYTEYILCLICVCFMFICISFGFIVCLCLIYVYFCLCYLCLIYIYLSVLYCAELTTAEKYCFSDPHCSGEKLFNGHVTTESNCCDDETAMSWGSLTQGVCQSCGQGKDHYSCLWVFWFF